MSELLHELLTLSTTRSPHKEALCLHDQSLTYAELANAVSEVANGLIAHELGRSERVAVYLPKRFETVIAFFATSLASGVFVPVNPLLKAEQVKHILKDCNARILITSHDRLGLLNKVLHSCHDLHTVIIVDKKDKQTETGYPFRVVPWFNIRNLGNLPLPYTIDSDIAAILYTSGSTGSPKGVVLSHRNMVTGAKSVAKYLENQSTDRILAVLPFSFDYGLSQLTTAFYVGATTVLMDYLLPHHVIRTVANEKITGLAGVPPLWIQLAELEWPEDAIQSLRYFTNSGGAMPRTTLNKLRKKLPNTRPYLMYGLTEAFRSTYLPPEEIDERPDSIGKAIPNAEILVIREDGSPCAPGEPGELVHRGSLVAMGYWNDPEKTSQRFKPMPNQDNAITIPEICVWSGDTVSMDEDGFLYFIGRKDEMIKSSGYRISPTEIEEVLYASGLVREVVAIGIPHPVFGQGIVVIITTSNPSEEIANLILAECKRNLPRYMVPGWVDIRDALPRNPNGKIDRKLLATELQDIFSDESI